MSHFYNGIKHDISHYIHIQNKRITEERFTYSDGRVCNLVIFDCDQSNDSWGASCIIYLIALPFYGAFDFTKQILRAELPYPDTFAICYDLVIAGDTLPRYGDMIRHIRADCDVFTVIITCDDKINTYHGNGGICIIEPYIDIKNNPWCNYYIRVESAINVNIGKILCGYIFQNQEDRNLSPLVSNGKK